MANNNKNTPERGSGSSVEFQFDNLNEENKKILQSKNDSTQKKKYNVKKRPVRKSIRLKINEDSYDSFVELGGKFYKENDALFEHNNANFLKLIMLNLNDYFVNKYGSLSDLNDNDLKFLKSVGKRFGDVDLYPHDKHSKFATSFTLEENVIRFFYQLAFTFYENERSNLYKYSIAFFFYDILNLINTPDFKLKYYSKDQINDFFDLE